MKLAKMENQDKLFQANYQSELRLLEGYNLKSIEFNSMLSSENERL